MTICNWLTFAVLPRLSQRNNTIRTLSAELSTLLIQFVNMRAAYYGRTKVKFNNFSFEWWQTYCVKPSVLSCTKARPFLTLFSNTVTIMQNCIKILRKVLIWLSVISSASPWNMTNLVWSHCWKANRLHGNYSEICDQVCASHVFWKRGMFLPNSDYL